MADEKCINEKCQIELTEFEKEENGGYCHICYGREMNERQQTMKIANEVMT